MPSADHKVMLLWNGLSRKKRLAVAVAIGSGIVAIGLMVSLTGAGKAGGEDAAIIEAVKDVARQSAFDPDAMKFRNMVVIRSQFIRTKVCGEMNGKNRMGGYTGFQPFVFNGPEANTLTMLRPGDSWCSGS